MVWGKDMWVVSLTSESLLGPAGFAVPEGSVDYKSVEIGKSVQSGTRQSAHCRRNLNLTSWEMKHYLQNTVSGHGLHFRC